MIEEKRCTVSRETGLPVAITATADISNMIALASTECGKSATHKLMLNTAFQEATSQAQIVPDATTDVVIAYLCGQHAESFKSFLELQVVSL